MGYGSTRSDQEIHRLIALSRCLGAVLALARGEREEVVGVGEKVILSTGTTSYPGRRLSGVQIECHLFVTGDTWLQPVVAAYDHRITCHRLNLEDSRRLPHAARRFLLEAEEPADLSLYLEDDLVINDRLYCDKLIWFLERTQHRFALMPHRFECTGDPAAERLFVDGPLHPDLVRNYQEPREHVARGTFWDGHAVSFDVASNPHSGSFALSRAQLDVLRRKGVADSGFVGPLETVATYTVLQHFQVWKPSWACRDFLAIEHGHPSFLYWRSRLPRR
jgi:hypothetical protein